METKKVSIITPCYNGAKFIHRLLDSILLQTYPNIEMYVVDDGSTDKSADIIKAYIPKFSAKDYKLVYIHQDNAGQSVAINNALKLFSGEYLVWPDCDDFYSSNSAISELVRTLDASKDSVSLARCHCDLLDEQSLSKISSLPNNPYDLGHDDLFEDCLFNQNGFWFGAGNYMAKAGKIKELIPALNIYTEKNAGQNWQILLPLLYHHKCITIPKVLYSILVREVSHSRGMYTTCEQVLNKYDAYERTVLSVLSTIPISAEEENYYRNKVRWQYKLIKLSNYIMFNEKTNALNMLKEMKECNAVIPLRLHFRVLLMNIPFGSAIVSFLKKIKDVALW